MTPNWVQAGELGLAFVVIILCVFLVRYVFNQSATRENRLMMLLEQAQRTTDRQTDVLQALANSVDKRLDAIEQTIEQKLRAKSTRTPKPPK